MPSSLPEPTVAAPQVVLAEPPSAKPARAEVAVPAEDRGSLTVAAAPPVPMTASASSEYPGWPAASAIDGDPSTSWFSSTNDSAAKGASPYLEVIFAEPRTVRAVTILGNRDPSYPDGYAILAGRLDLVDRAGRVVISVKGAGSGGAHDFDFRLREPVAAVRAVRFTSLRDEGDSNDHGDVAVAELRVE